MTELEQHHIRYEELHGEDEIILLTHAEHMKAHREDIVNGFEPIPKWISDAAHARSPGRKISIKEYEQSERGKVAWVKYQKSRTGEAKRSNWRHSNVGKISARASSTKYRVKQKEMKS